MSKYTTGELAGLGGVTVRTVQYYDSRGILIPSELTEGGRRLYSDEDLKKLKVICFLRHIGLSINDIAHLLQDDHPENVIGVLLMQQVEMLRKEEAERNEKLRSAEQLLEGLKGRQFSVETIQDIAYTMEKRENLRRVHRNMLVIGVIMDLIEAGGLLLWIFKGIWWPFVACIPVIVLMGVLISGYYYRHTDYICPQCHEIFHPRLREMFFASHTPKTRKLSCPACGHKGYCVETYREPKSPEQSEN